MTTSNEDDTNRAAAPNGNENNMNNENEKLTRQIKRLKKELSDTQAELGATQAKIPTKKFGLIWEDQPEDVEQEMYRKFPVLTEYPEKAIAGTPIDGHLPHLLIEGDNLHSLTALQYAYAGKVDVIYIDPPYATGNTFNFGDDYENSAYASFMHKRLLLARNLLSDTGVIFVSIDDNQQANLKKVMDEIFSKDENNNNNFLTNFIWTKKVGGGQAKYLYETHEYILCYAKNKNLAGPLTAGKTVSEKDIIEIDGVKYFKYGGWLRKEHGRKTSDETSALFYEDIEVFHKESGATKGAKDAAKAGEDIAEGAAKGAADGAVKGAAKKQKIDKGIASGEMMLQLHGKSGKHEVIKLQPLNGLRKKVPSQIPLKVYSSTGNDEALDIGITFSNPKPLDLIKYLLDMQLSDKPNAIVLDFFAGSGTTGHSVAALNAEDGGNRQAILCTNNLESEDFICEKATLVRMQRALSGKGWADKADHPLLPGSLKYFKTSFVSREGGTDYQMRQLARRSADLVGMREGTFDKWDKKSPRAMQVEDLYVTATGLNKFLAVWYSHTLDVEKMVELRDSAPMTGEKILYIFSYTGVVHREIEEMFAGWRVESIPEELYKIFSKYNNAEYIEINNDDTTTEGEVQ